MESTYSVAGQESKAGQSASEAVKRGLDEGIESPLTNTKVHVPEWFDESPSAGKTEAWQTHYPAVDGSIVGNRHVRGGIWRATAEGWTEDYEPSRQLDGEEEGRKTAGWFDSSVNNVDGFGRKRLPDSDDPRRLLESPGWKERAWNTTIQCAGVGCTGSASLALYDTSSEEAQNCRLSILLHPTDFEDDWSKEGTKEWLINNRSVPGKCDPMTRGCNASAWRPLFSCLNSVPVDHLISSEGQLLVQGTLDPMVDECPYEGNLLSGVVLATCMVRTKATTPSPAERIDQARPERQMELYGVNASGPLQCRGPGCTARMTLAVDPKVAMLGGSCFLNVTINQTDYDGGVDGAPEVIDFLAIDDQNISVSIKPGKNPCNSEYEGKTVSVEERAFSVMESHNVTAQVLARPAGSIVVSGKNSQHVDECATKAGFLLDGWVSLVCLPPPGGITKEAVAAAAKAAGAAGASAVAASTAEPATSSAAAETTADQSTTTPVILIQEPARVNSHKRLRHRATAAHPH